MTSGVWLPLDVMEKVIPGQNGWYGSFYGRSYSWAMIPTHISVALAKLKYCKIYWWERSWEATCCHECKPYKGWADTGIGSISISALFYSIGIGNQSVQSASINSGISTISGIGKGQYKHIGVSTKMWYQPIPTKLPVVTMVIASINLTSLIIS